jgi:ABC-type multidrug transport system ATPase subunit
MFKMGDSIIQVKNLTKIFNEIKAVDALSFSVGAGEVYGFLGQNGAGKSTTIRMLLTLIKPTSGSINVLGKNLEHHRNEVLSQVGAIIEKPDLYKYLTAFENLKILAQLSGAHADRNDLLRQLEVVGLGDRAHSKVKTFSQGMKQRLGIACALIHQPKLIILDEPTNGLDPQGIADIRNLILRLSREEKKTILVSSHLLSEMELIADSMLIIDKGKKLKEGKVATLLADLLVEIQTTDNEASLRKIQDSSWNKHIKKTGEKIILSLHQSQIPELNKSLVAMGVDVIALQPKHSLEDYFLSLTTPNQHVATYQD